MIHETKHMLRRELAARRDSLSERAQRSRIIAATVAELPYYRAAQAIHCYLSMRSEVETQPLLEAAAGAGKQIAVPLVLRGMDELEHRWLSNDSSLERGPLGTRNPTGTQASFPGDWQLIIVPLLGFDREGYRLGYGKGYYDKLLVHHSAPTIGVAFAAQEVPRIPREPHDIPLDMIVTENEVITFR